MELLSMHLKNYRRFTEETTIDFATGTNNVTIISAENGAGKTGILMALLFGLFGVVKYEQFQIQSDRDYMVGEALLTNGKSATCTVSVTFIEDEAKYKIVRSIRASNINGIIVQENDRVETKLFKEGIELDKTTDEINRFMNSIIGENIRGFLFFDGVKYTELFKQNDTQTKRELQKIIEKMLNINDLENAINALKTLASKLSSRGGVTSSTSKKIADKLNEIRGLEADKKEQEDIEDKANKKYKELYDAYQAALEKAKDLDQFKDVATKIQTINSELEAQKSALSTLYTTLQKSTSQFLLSSIFSSMGQESKIAFEKLAMDTKGGADLVRMILDSGRCICCDSPLTDAQRANLNAYLSTINSTEEVPLDLSSRARTNLYAIKMGSDGSLFESTIDAIVKAVKDIDGLLQERAQLESEIPNDQNLDQILDGIKKSAEEQGGISTYMNQQHDAAEKAGNAIRSIEIELEKKNKELEELQQIANLEAGTQREYQYYADVKKKLLELKQKYLKEAQEDISNRANDFFLSLLSDDDKNTYKSLSLAEDYSIRVYKHSGQESFAQLSAGQKLLASMAFVMGLTAAASKAKPTCNFPLVMDTPFSNLDLQNRRSLIALMPSVVRQWIITPIDTELTNNEIGFFNESNHVGNVYKLRKDGPKTTLEHLSGILDLVRGN